MINVRILPNKIFMITYILSLMDINFVFQYQTREPWREPSRDNTNSLEEDYEKRYPKKNSYSKQYIILALGNKLTLFEAGGPFQPPLRENVHKSIS